MEPRGRYDRQYITGTTVTKSGEAGHNTGVHLHKDDTARDILIDGSENRDNLVGGKVAGVTGTKREIGA